MAKPPEEPLNVLFLCTGNSARSIIAEAVLNKLGRGKFRAYSAGSQPKGAVNPHTLQLLKGLGYDISGLHSKSWAEFAKPGAPRSILYSRSAAALRRKPVRCGLANR